MQIVINHLTRMQKGFMCTAGLDLETGRHIRPLLQSQMRTRFLARHGGPFEIGAIVDLGWTKPIGRRPAFEDHLYHRSEARRAGDMSANEFWQFLEQTAKWKLGEIFGPELRQRGAKSYAVEVGNGDASLGCYLTDSRPDLYIQRRDSGSRGRIRIEFQTGDYQFELGVTDIRLYGPDHFSPDDEAVRRTSRRLKDAPEVILSVGLTRPFGATESQPDLHWLQVNNLHFEDDPCWQLG